MKVPIRSRAHRKRKHTHLRDESSHNADSGDVTSSYSASSTRDTTSSTSSTLSQPKERITHRINTRINSSDTTRRLKREYSVTECAAQEQSSHDSRLLSAWGIPHNICKNYYRVGVVELFEWQHNCLQVDNRQAFEKSKNLVYTAPTGCGKTLVAELLLIRRVLITGGLAIMVVPFLSIVIEKTNYLKRVFLTTRLLVQGLQSGAKGLSPTCNVCVCTIERANSIVNRKLELHTVHEISCVVCDETHILSNDRGARLEAMMSKLMYFNRLCCGHRVQIIALSATLTISGAQTIANWLNASVFVSTVRDVALHHHVVVGTKVFDHSSFNTAISDTQFCSVFELRESSVLRQVTELSKPLVSAGNCVIVFCASKKQCVSYCTSIIHQTHSIFTSLNTEQIAARVKLRNEISQLTGGMFRTLDKCISEGIAWHHAGLLVEVRELIEAAFRERIILLLMATTTLSAGVNINASRVIITWMKAGAILLDIIQYRQMCGRAGRVGIGAGKGDSFLLLPQGLESEAQKFLKCEIPSLSSALIDSRQGFAALLLESIASTLCTTRQHCASLVECTMLRYASMRSDVAYDPIVDKSSDVWIAAIAAQSLLERHQFIEWKQASLQGCSSIVQATKLGMAAFASSLSPSHALVVFQSLSRARQQLQLDNVLAVVYLIAPVRASMCTPNWPRFLHWFIKAAHTPTATIAKACGITENVLQLQCNQCGSIAPLRYHRFWQAIVLTHLLRGEHLNDVAHTFACSTGDVQSLLTSSATFAGMVTTFCERLHFFKLYILCGDVAESLRVLSSCNMNAAQDKTLSSLMMLPGLRQAEAKRLYDGGFNTLAQVAESRPLQVVGAMLRYSQRGLDNEDEQSIRLDQPNRNINTLIHQARILIHKAQQYLCMNTNHNNASGAPVISIHIINATVNENEFHSFSEKFINQCRFSLDITLCCDNDKCQQLAYLGDNSLRCHHHFSQANTIAVCWIDSPIYTLSLTADVISSDIIWKLVKLKLQDPESIKIFASNAESCIVELQSLEVLCVKPVQDPLTLSISIHSSSNKETIVSELPHSLQHLTQHMCVPQVQSTGADLSRVALRCWQALWLTEKLLQMKNSMPRST